MLIYTTQINRDLKMLTTTKKEIINAEKIIIDAAASIAAIIEASRDAAAEVVIANAKAAAEVVITNAKAAAEVVITNANAAAADVAEINVRVAAEVAEINVRVAAEVAEINTKASAEISALIKSLSVANENYRKAERKIKRFAFYDVLTGLPNRRKLLDHMNDSIKLSRRESKKFAVFMLDLDKFKAVNDTLGHEAGDDLLKQVSVRIKARLRDSDMVARLGGDEFVIVLANCPINEDAEKVANEVIADLTVPFALSDGNVAQIGASIGISFYPQNGITPEKLIKAADVGLYQAKDKGRGCCCYANPAPPK
jgi:diguanylate cyclase (GGDEF)-like protein